MSRQVVSVPSDVRSAYENFLESFRAAAEFADRKVKFPVNGCFTDSGRGTMVAFKRCLYLEDWPCRRQAGSKRLHIVIKALEEIEKRTWMLRKSTVYVNYIAVSNATGLLVQALHYDFEDGGQHHHPFFHVQLTNKPIPEDDLRSAGFNLELRLPEQSSEWPLITRIPTPDMTFASVLYCLAADHLRERFFSQFAQRMGSLQEKLPRPSFVALKKSLQMSSEHLKSSHWFSHMNELPQQNR